MQKNTIRPSNNPEGVMLEKTIGFFTEQSAQNWLFEHGDLIKITDQKQMKTSPYLIVEMAFPGGFEKFFFPEGVIMERSLVDYDGKLL